ncbi:MAG TPA: DsbA family protein [Terriglobia bacterium]|nr:DsbA family protein [Terriglobia bacterium]
MFAITLVLVGLIVGPAAGWAQSSDEDIKALRKEVEELKAGQDAMQKDITAIKDLITPKKPKPFEGADLSIQGEPFMGEKDAKVTMVEFSDYQCPFCGRNFQQTFPQIVTDYVKTGKVKYVFHDFPLEQLHPNAFKAAEAARCAGEQGKYWDMHDKLFQNQRALDAAKLPDYAKAAGLDVDKFQACLTSDKDSAQIRAELAAGAKVGVTGTPAFFLGVTEPNQDKIHATKFISGAQPYTNFKAAIDELLNPPKEQPNEKAAQKPAEKPTGKGM